MTTDGAPRPLEGLRVLPLASPPRALLDAVLVEISRHVRVPVRLGAPPPDFTLPRLAGRDQLDADRLLERLEDLERLEGELVVGLTPRDIGHPIFTFFFGRARHEGRAILVSMARLAPSFYGLPEDLALTAHRTAMEVVHELGHVVGLAHCHDAACVMRFCANVEGIDNRGVTFCGQCAKGLRGQRALRD